MKKVNKAMSEHMRAIGSRGGKKTAEKGTEYMRELGRKGYKALVRRTVAAK